MATRIPTPEESARLGDILSGLIGSATDPDIKAALQARLNPQPLPQAPAVPTLEQALQARQMPQPIAPEATPELRALPPGMVGMSALLPAPAPASFNVAPEILGGRRLPQQWLV